MLTTVKKTSIDQMPANVALEVYKFIGNVATGYFSYTVTAATASSSPYPQLDNWLMNLGADYGEEILIFCFLMIPSINR